jgi:hypothetical protein
VATDGLILWLDAGDYASYPGERSLAGAWADYGSHQADYDVVGDDGVILLGTYTSWQGNFVSTTTATGNHTVMFDYWSNNDSTAFSIDNDGSFNDNEYNTTLTANKKKQTFSKTINLTSTGTSTMFIRPHATGSKVYIANYRFFESGTTWRDLTGHDNFNLSAATSPAASPDRLDLNTIYASASLGSSPPTAWRGVDECTIETWYYMDSPYGSCCDTIFGRYDFRFFQISGSLYTMIGFHDGSGGRTYQHPAYSVASSTWHHLVGMRRGNDYIIWIDGAQVYNTNWGTGLELYGANNQAWTINTNRHNAEYSVCRIYNRGLTDAEIKQNYNIGRDKFGV